MPRPELPKGMANVPQASPARDHGRVEADEADALRVALSNWDCRTATVANSDNSSPSVESTSRNSLESQSFPELALDLLASHGDGTAASSRSIDRAVPPTGVGSLSALVVFS